MALETRFPLKIVIGVLLLGLLWPFLHERGNVLAIFYRNTPQRLTKVDALGSYEIKFADQIRSCEDVLLLEDQHLAILACDAGRERWNTVLGLFLPGDVVNADLWAYDYDDTSDSEALRRIKLEGFPEGQDLHTLGMGYDRLTSTLFVTNHARNGPRIEMFNLDTSLMTATYIQTIQHPSIHGPNAIAVINSNEFYVTNAHFFTMQRSRILCQLETYLGLPLGTVVHVTLQGPEIKAEVVAHIPYANGIDFLNETTVAIASTSRGAIYLYDHTKFQYLSQIRLPFLPDNLSVSGRKLLIAGHAHPPTTTKFSQTRHICNDPEELAHAAPSMQEYCAKGQATSWVSEWSEKDGLKHLYVSTEYPTSSSVVKDAKTGSGIISGLYAKGILVWRS